MFESSVGCYARSPDFHRVHVLGTQNIADPLSHLIDGKPSPPEHKHGAEQYVLLVTINAMSRAMNTCDVDAAPSEGSDGRNVTETSHDSSMSREFGVVGTPSNDLTRTRFNKIAT